MHRSDCVASLLLVAFGLLALFVVIPSQVADADAIGLPPRGMPIFTAAAVTFLSGLLLIKSLFFSPRAAAAPFDLRQLLAMLTGLVIAIAGTVLFAFAGFVASGLFVIVALMLFMGERNWRLLATVPVGAVAVMYLFVTRLLHVAVP